MARPAKPLRLPEWTDGLPDDTLITASDLAKAMGLKSAQGVMRRAGMPPPDRWFGTSIYYRQHGRKRHRWQLGTIRAAIKESQQ